MKKITKNQKQKYTSDQIQEKFKSLINELDSLDDFEIIVRALFEMQNILFNKMKNVVDKKKMQPHHIELFRIHIMNKNNKN